jgi:hypothetical protein
MLLTANTAMANDAAYDQRNHAMVTKYCCIFPTHGANPQLETVNSGFFEGVRLFFTHHPDVIRLVEHDHWEQFESIQ